MGEEALQVFDQPSLQTELSVSREPALVLQEARKAATALADVLNNKPKKVMIRGKQFLEFEDWLTVARFYGATVKVVSTAPVKFGDVHGFEATAEVLLVGTGQVISGAESMCLNDEENWGDKPLFQLRSMAQTRACAKSLRNVFAWVVVLAGFAPTPAEEMTAAQPLGEKPAATISAAQVKRIWAIGFNASPPKSKAEVREIIGKHGFASADKITKDKYDLVCGEIEGQGGSAVDAGG